MKTSLLILGTAGLVLALNAQTNAPDPSPKAEAAAATTPTVVQTSAAPRERLATEIFSDSANFDLKTRIAVYIGNVRVQDSKMTLTCDIMTAHVPQSGRLDSIVAEQNVVIKALDDEGKPVDATCDKAVYTYRVVNLETNETIVLTGNPQVKSQMYSGSGTTITWDRVNNSIGATSPHMIIQSEAKERTTAPPAEAPEKKKIP